MKKAEREDMIFKEITVNDYDRMVKLWQESGLPHKPAGRDSREEIGSQLNDSHCLILGLFYQKKLIGTIIANWEGRKGWINRLAIAPDFRRMGLGCEMISRAEDWLRKKGARIIACLVEEWNSSSLELFKKAGYIIHRDIFYLSKRDNNEV
jgi:ribosomal protein S18 acetylase RimI-like enzyme